VQAPPTAATSVPHRFRQPGERQHNADTPAIWLNEETMAKYRPALKKYYYDPTKYKTYLDQLGIKYPTLR